MRNLILATVCLWPFLSSGQTIPNSGFENWMSVNGILEPENWTTDNSETQDEQPVTRETDAYEGVYAMQVDAKIQALGSYGEATTDFPISMIPQALNFYTKYYCAFGGVGVEIFFYNNSSLISSAQWFGTDTLETYGFISIPLEPSDSAVTHAVIKVSASVGDFAPGSARILVDQMDFGFHTSVNEKAGESFLIYPNPANKTVHLDAERPIGKVIIYDSSGRAVLSQNGISTNDQIDISTLKPGIYTLFSESGTRKLVVE